MAKQAKTEEKKGASFMGRANAMASSKKKPNKKVNKEKRGGLKEYFKGVRLEMKKVVWPTKKELGSYTIVVLATCAAFALAFWGIDSGVLAAIRAICF